MSAFSDYLEQAIGDFWLRANAGAYSSPATIYLALYTSDPTDADAGTEVTGGSYARQAVTFTDNLDGSFDNAEVQFAGMPAVTGVSHWGIHDASTGGNLLYHGAWGTPVDYTSGETAIIAAGDITITHA